MRSEFLCRPLLAAGGQGDARAMRNLRVPAAGLLAAACLLGYLAAAPPVLAQREGNVLLEGSEQLFVILSALTASGHDPGAGAATGSETRQDVRAWLAKKNIPVLPELRQFFSEHHVAGDPGADLAQYVSLALLLGPPPDFRFTVLESDLPPDAKALAALVPLLRKFYKQADLITLWARYLPLHEAEIDRSSEAVRSNIALSDAYFRFPSGAYLGRTYNIYLSLLGAPEQVHARIYGLNYYLVVMPSKAPKLAEIRHQYLHFLLDPLAVKYAREIKQKSALQGLVRSAPRLASDFKEDFPLFVTECLIRAAELRLEKLPKADAEKSIQELTASGFVLVPYFYAALLEYERQDATMNVVYRDLIGGIDIDQEKKRLASVEFAPLQAGESPAASARSEEERLLDQGDNLVFDGRYKEARDIYRHVAENINPRSGRALFGLAVTASGMQKPDLAEEYFLKTLEVARDLRIVSWSHIYLGRLYDLRGKRQEALDQYRAASLTAATYPDAWRAVQNGLQKPFGSQE